MRVAAAHQRSALAVLLVVPALLALAGPRLAFAGPDWDPIPPEHLAQTKPVVEPEAGAEALLWRVQVEDEVESEGILSIRRHFLRVKVFTQQGAQDWSRRDIDYPQKGVRILDLSARTIQPDGSVRVMDRKAISEETIVKGREGKLKRTSFALPAVQPGSIIEYRYTEYRRDDNVYSDSYPFQLDIPAQRVVYRVRPISWPGLTMRQLTFRVATRPPDSPSGGYYVTEATNQRAFVFEPDMPPRQQQIAFMVCFYTTDEENSPDRYWPAVGRRQAEWFDDATKPDNAIKQATAKIVQGATDPRERVERIAKWVRSNVRIARSGSRDSLRAMGLSEVKHARGAFAQGGGYYRDAMLVFGSMVRAAGLETRWAMVPQRTELFFDRNMLSESFLDSYQVAVRLDGTWTTVDPCLRYLPWDMQEWSEEAANALLCDRDSSRFIETPIAAPERTTRARRADLDLQPDGTLKGTLRTSFSGHFNGAIRRQFDGVTAQELDSTVSTLQADDGSNTTFSKVQLLNRDAQDEPLTMTSHVELPGFAAVTGKRILLEPAVFQAHAKPRYTSSKRRNPVYFEHAWCELDTIMIRLPEGWVVQEAESVQPLSAEGVATYTASVMVGEEGRLIRYVRGFRMGIDGSIYFPPKYYEGVKQFFDSVHERDGISLSLARAEAKP